MLKRTEVIAVWLTDQGSLLMISEGRFFRQSLAESEWTDRFQPGKILKTIEHVSYPIGCCKLSLLMYSGNCSCSNFFSAIDNCFENLTG